MFATHDLREGVPKRGDWPKACEAGLGLLNKRGRELVEALGFDIEQLGVTTSVLTTGGRRRAVAVFLDEAETPETSSPRFDGSTPISKGAIKRLVAPLDPRHVRVAQFAAPTPDEKRHHFLIRFSDKLPGWGGMAVFDRTWYGRVLVERVEGFATKKQWRRAYSEIRGFEESLPAEGTVIVKFWLHISEDEQLKRFERRRNEPLRAWKLTDEDWRNRERRKDYEAAVEEMLERTDHPAAPWILIPAESKRFARIAVLEHTVAAIEAGMAKWGLELPDLSASGE
jgi:hypothetical protein